MSKPTPILFLDLDGTVRHPPEGKRYINDPDDVVIYDGVPELLARYKEDGWRIAGITNQGGIALDLVSSDAVMAAVSRTVKLCGGKFDMVAVCPHHPDAPEPERSICMCRKPRIGNLVFAIMQLQSTHGDEHYPVHMALMVGDMPSDEECARNAGVKFKWAEDWRREALS